MAVRARYPENAPGDWYVEQGCCLRCTVPLTIAPELFAFQGDAHCYVKCQPRNALELERMVTAADHAEVGCIRYAGDQPAVVRRMVELGLEERLDGGATMGIRRRVRAAIRRLLTWVDN